MKETAAFRAGPGERGDGFGTSAPAPRAATWPRLALSLALCGAVLAPPLLAALAAWRSWDAATRGAEAEVARTADAAAEYARRLLEGQLLRLQRANDALAGLSDAGIGAREADLHAVLRGISAQNGVQASEIFYLTVFDRDSRLLVASNLLPVRRDLLAEAREYGTVLRADDAPPFHVGPVYVGRVTGRPYFALTARRERTGNGLPPGDYDGVINASLYIDQVNLSLRALASSPDRVVSLVRTDGALLARSAGFGNLPAEEPRLGPGSAMVAAMRRGEERSVAREHSTIDGMERVAAYRRVGGSWPVYVAAARARSAVVAEWWRQVLPQAVLALASSTLLLLMARGVLGRQRKLERANEALESRVAERTRALAGSARMMQLAQQAAKAAAWSWEPGPGRVRWSPEMFALLGLDPVRDAASASAETFFAAVHPADRDRLREAIGTALREGAMGLELRVFRRVPDGQEEVWLLCRARLVPAGEEGPETLVGVHVDITDRHRIAERLEVAVGAIEGFIYERDLTTGRTVSTGSVAALLGEEIAGAAAWIGRIHPDDRPCFEREVEGRIADPARDLYAAEYRIRRADGSWAWVWDRGRVFRDPGTGRALRSLGGILDVTARRLAEDRQALLMREVDHRGKNALAVVKAALRLTPGNDPVYRAAIEGRVDALARAQSLLAETNWTGTSLRAVLRSTLAPFLDEGVAPHAVLDGPDVLIPGKAVQALTMALHELATNATKYGALSVETGILRVSWQVEDATLRLCWAETGGPEVAAPLRKGFGSRVVDNTLANQLGGSVTWNWSAPGLAVALGIPLGQAA